MTRNPKWVVPHQKFMLKFKNCEKLNYGTVIFTKVHKGKFVCECVNIWDEIKQEKWGMGRFSDCYALAPRNTYILRLKTYLLAACLRSNTIITVMKANASRNSTKTKAILMCQMNI